MLKITIAVCGDFAVIWRAASIPFRFGMPMSATTTCGEWASVSRTASRPSPASATTLESSPVILDQNVDVLRPLFDRDPHRLGAGVTNTVVQGLLHHAVDASLVLLGKAVGNPVHGY